MKIDKHSADLVEQAKLVSAAIQKRDWKEARTRLQTMERFRVVVSDVLEAMIEMIVEDTTPRATPSREHKKREKLEPFGAPGELTEFMRKRMRDMRAGEVLLVELPSDKKSFSLDRFQAAASAAAHQLFGASNYTTALRREEFAVEVMRHG